MGRCLSVLITYIFKSRGLHGRRFERLGVIWIAELAMTAEERREAKLEGIVDPNRGVNGSGRCEKLLSIQLKMEWKGHSMSE